MNNYFFDELANIQVAFSTLREFNQYVLFPVSEDVIGSPELKVYFTSPLDSPIEKIVEKIVGIAAAKAVFDNPHIPEKNKKQSALNTARDIREAMRYAKLEYLAQTTDLSHREYMRRKRSIPIVERIAWIKMAKKTATFLSIKMFANAVAGPFGGRLVRGTRLLWNLVPKDKREKIISGGEDIVIKAKDTIKNCYDDIQSTWISERMSPLIQNIEDEVQGIIDLIKSYKPYKERYDNRDQESTNKIYSPDRKLREQHEKGIPESADNGIT